ncbi:MAG: hypothetical protein JO299_08675 [Gammaproteobacteria bacterium]|nr:hypothetical protein [Gammaproteobacteria bacterium]
MKTIAAAVLLLIVCANAAGQESPTRSVTTDRLGSWAPHESNSCDAIYGEGRALCLADRFRIHQEQQAKDALLALQSAQVENLRLHSEVLRLQLARTQSAPSAADIAATPGFVNWQAENRWFGSDRARTEFALLYAKDLRQEQPELNGRSFLNALATRVNEVFASAKR